MNYTSRANWKSSKEDAPYSTSEYRDWAKEKPTEPSVCEHPDHFAGVGNSMVSSHTCKPQREKPVEIEELEIPDGSQLGQMVGECVRKLNEIIRYLKNR